MTTKRTTLVGALFISGLAWSHLAASHDGPAVPTPMDLPSLTKAFGMDIENTEITTQKITDNFYVLFGAGGNIAVSTGSNGVLIVDDQFPALIGKIENAIQAVGGGKVDFAINTHWHFDHAEGNLVLGPQGTHLVAHANSRRMMLQDQVINLVAAAYQQKAYPKEALPVITYNDAMQFHFNDQEIELLHFGPAHTTGDTAVIFRGANAVHLGDVFNNSGYPFIDAGNGGSLDGVIGFCQGVLQNINAQTAVIPGHGAVSNYQGLVNYIAMLTTVRERLLQLINQGASLQEVMAANITAEFDQQYGTSEQFINRAYMSTLHRIVDR